MSMNKLTLALVETKTGSWRYVLKADGRQLWQSNAGDKSWAERNAVKQFPGLEME